MSSESEATGTASPPGPTDLTGASSVSERDRILALRAGPAPVPRKFIVWIIVGFAVLGLGGLIVDKLVGNGVASSPSALAENTGGQNGIPSGTTFVPQNPAPAQGPSISAPITAFMSLKSLGHTKARPINLTNVTNSPWTIAKARGHVLVVTFANAECNDACTILAREIAVAESALGPKASHVTFAVVNTDPLETSVRPTPALLSETKLGSLANVTYLTGSVHSLSRVWASYGVQVVVLNATRTVTHNDIMYFIDPTGHLRFQVTPFANEGANGTYTLSAQDTNRFGHGIASVVTQLEGSS